ncbi:hypothetical protein [Nocardia sp. NRRL S-836]|uniref:RICIN domain-containing protein n=1 Tax=Nocardia sp. NRRL S-836 TaxID=1519492 RepID=UPI0006AF2DC4|nr:hypothetical protein [Nocardia sp. NRRL S-836]KOV84970.1 hypothetical protein ADL03_11335 [Nocardia sp. NRRL S-836]
MEIRGIVRRITGAGAVVAATAAMLLGGVSGAATANTGAGEVTAAVTYLNIKHASARTCLDSNAAGAVYTRVCESGNRNQQWDNSTLGKFKNVATGRCLASTGSAVLTLGACSDTRTNWTTTSGSPKYIKNVNYGICAHNNGGNGEAVGPAACASATRWSTLAAA